MIKTGRNAPCICGSEKKYKKCCLYRGVSVPVSGTDSKTSGNILVKTLTDEFFQPVRLYYIIHNETGLQEIFNGSSAKSMGRWWLLKSTKLVIERYLQAIQCFKAVCLFDSEFCLVI